MSKLKGICTIGELGAVNFGNMDRELRQIKCLAGLTQNVITQTWACLTECVAGDLSPVWRISELCPRGDGVESKKFIV